MVYQLIAERLIETQVPAHLQYAVKLCCLNAVDKEDIIPYVGQWIERILYFLTHGFKTEWQVTLEALSYTEMRAPGRFLEQVLALYQNNEAFLPLAKRVIEPPLAAFSLENSPPVFFQEKFYPDSAEEYIKAKTSYGNFRLLMPSLVKRVAYLFGATQVTASQVDLLVCFFDDLVALTRGEYEELTPSMLGIKEAEKALLGKVYKGAMLAYLKQSLHITLYNKALPSSLPNGEFERLSQIARGEKYANLSLEDLWIADVEIEFGERFDAEKIFHSYLLKIKNLDEKSLASLTCHILDSYLQGRNIRVIQKLFLLLKLQEYIKKELKKQEEQWLKVPLISMNDLIESAIQIAEPYVRRDPYESEDEIVFPPALAQEEVDSFFRFFAKESIRMLEPQFTETLRLMWGRERVEKVLSGKLPAYPGIYLYKLNAEEKEEIYSYIAPNATVVTRKLSGALGIISEKAGGFDPSLILDYLEKCLKGQIDFREEGICFDERLVKAFPLSYLQESWDDYQKEKSVIFSPLLEEHMVAEARILYGHLGNQAFNAYLFDSFKSQLIAHYESFLYSPVYGSI